MLLLIDNYDSFTFNLYQLVAARVGPNEVCVARNDEAVGPLLERAWSHVILSPGPGHPRAAGLSLTLPAALPGTPILGVCLGHQALAWEAGLSVVRAPHPTHGATVSIRHDGTGLFAGLGDPLDVALYHSLVVEEPPPGHAVRVSARTNAGAIMALSRADRPHHGVQFHPESFMTEQGSTLIDNFLSA